MSPMLPRSLFALSICSQFGICIKTFLVFLSLGLDNDRFLSCLPLSLFFFLGGGFLIYFSFNFHRVDHEWKRRLSLEKLTFFLFFLFFFLPFPELPWQLKSIGQSAKTDIIRGGGKRGTRRGGGLHI